MEATINQNYDDSYNTQVTETYIFYCMLGMNQNWGDT
jgi:hypothetical protein